jgi:lipopolysaccharide biosynthesis glycosyltransferase
VLEIACAADGDYVPHGAAALHSLLEQVDGAARIHLLQGPGVTAEDQSHLSEMVESHGGQIHFIPVPADLCAGLPDVWSRGKVTWYRIFAADLLPDVDRALFLDLDIIVLGSLRALWETELGDRYLAAVTNVLSPIDGKRLVRAGFDPRAYFNAGVMLMDLERLRQDQCGDAMRRYALTERLLLWDQDALNAVLGPHRLALHPRWNCMNSFFEFGWSEKFFGPGEIEEAKSDPAIRHFEGPAKPWHYLGDRASVELYAKHRRQTPWPDFEIQGFTPFNVLRRVKVLRRVRRRMQGRPPRQASIPR